jgi:hypothetical protein
MMGIEYLCKRLLQNRRIGIKTGTLSDAHSSKHMLSTPELLPVVKYRSPNPPTSGLSATSGSAATKPPHHQ